MILDLNTLTTMERQYYLQHVVAPRPIALASTIDKKGNVNLSPFSFYNLFSSNPPIVIFSPARRVRDNTIKHTLENVLEVPEVVINMVNYDIVQQVSLSSMEYPKEFNEYLKSGLTMVPATKVQPPMVEQSPVKMECKVIEVKALGTEGGAGNLVICEVLCMHIEDTLLDDNKKFDQRKMDHVARLGGDWYCRVTPESLFTVPKPTTHLGIGFDQLPAPIRHSKIFTGNDLGLLAGVLEIPAIDAAYDDPHLRQIIQYYSVNPEEMEKELHAYAKTLLEKGNVSAAWQVLLVNSF